MKIYSLILKVYLLIIKFSSLGLSCIPLQACEEWMLLPPGVLTYFFFPN